MAQFAVIGLGSFGATIATQLVSLNHDVIGIDSNKKYVENKTKMGRKIGRVNKITVLPFLQFKKDTN